MKAIEKDALNEALVQKGIVLFAWIRLVETCGYLRPGRPRLSVHLQKYNLKKINKECHLTKHKYIIKYGCYS